jgi:AraC family transcriptional regulator
LLSETQILPAVAVELLRSRKAIAPFPTPPTVSSRYAGWHGISMQSFNHVPACYIPDHEHPILMLNLQRSGQTRCEWTTEGRTRKAEHGPGNLYILPAGTRDRFTRWAPTNHLTLVMAPYFLARVLEESAHPADLELIPNWNLRDPHIASLMLALYADLEDSSPAGPLFGESLGVALAHYLLRRYSARMPRQLDYKGGMPTARLNRVLDFMRENCAKEMRIWELAQLAGMSPHYFCELFKKSTGLSPHQYCLRCRIDLAKVFLRSPQYAVNRVAKATGFADQSHFTKVFRRMVGVTPTQFRQLG